MKRFTFLKSLLALFLFINIGGGSKAFADDFVSVFKTQQTPLSTSLPVESGNGCTWTASKEPNAFDTNSGVRGYSWSKPENVTVTSDESYNNVVKVTIIASSNQENTNTISVTVGGEAIGETLTLPKANNQEYEFSYSGNGSLNGKVTLTLDHSNGKSTMIKSITVTTIEGGTIYVQEPKFSVAAGTYSKPFDLTLSAPNASMIMYTLDGNDPSFENKVGEIYDEPIHISTTTTVKAIALDNDKNASSIASATYTLVTIGGDGSFENPYTVADLRILGEEFTANDVWVKGSIVGVYDGGELEYPTTTRTNIALGTESDYIPVQLPKGSIRDILNLGDNSEMLNREVILHGDLATYFSTLGLKNTDKAAGLGEIKVSAAGYSTFFTDMPFEVPAGIEAGIITGAGNGKLTVDYHYTEGDRVPANTGLLIKAAEGTYPIIIINSSAQTPDNNYLKGSVNGGLTEGEGCLFYMLSYDQEGKNLGFYWGAADGAAFENGAGKAYLALPQTVASQVRGFVLDGTTTGISGVTTEANNAPAAVYSLTGVRMGTTTDNLPAGIYIVNGKKVLVK